MCPPSRSGIGRKLITARLALSIVRKISSDDSLRRRAAGGRGDRPRPAQHRNRHLRAKLLQEANDHRQRVDRLVPAVACTCSANVVAVRIRSIGSKQEAAGRDEYALDRKLRRDVDRARLLFGAA